MAVPTAITDLSATIASNSPAGGDTVFPELDNYLRAAFGFIRQGDAKASDVASATTTDLGAAAGRIVDVTGTTTITSFGTVAAGVWRIVRFTGALTLTHNATSLILPGSANITTTAGDCAIAVSLGSGNWVVTHYQKVGGYATTAYVDAKFGAKCSVYMANTLSLTASLQTLPFDTEVFDTASAFNTSTHKFTAPTAGYYQVNAMLVAYSGSQTGKTTINFSMFVGATLKAVAVASTQDTTPTEYFTLTIAKVVYLEAAETVYFQASCPTTASAAGVAMNGAAYSNVSIVFLS